MNTWFISDPHFSHRNIAKFCPRTRPDTDPTIMDERMILRWNTMVHPEDEIWILGDVFFCDEKRALMIASRLAGHKHLIYGNHDKVIRNSRALQHHFETIDEYKEITIDRQKLCLFHFPIEEWNSLHHGSIHLHGHIHDRMADVPGRILNVCMDSPTFSDCAYGLYNSREVIRVGLSRPVRKHA